MSSIVKRELVQGIAIIVAVIMFADFFLGWVNFVVLADDLAIAIEKDRGVEHSGALFRFQSKNNARGMFSRPDRKPFRDRPRNGFRCPIAEEFRKAGDVWAEGSGLIQAFQRKLQEILRISWDPGLTYGNYSNDWIADGVANRSSSQRIRSAQCP